MVRMWNPWQQQRGLFLFRKSSSLAYSVLAERGTVLLAHLGVHRWFAGQSPSL